MTGSEQTLRKIAKALVRPRKPGRPRKSLMGDDDTLRAFLVVETFSRNPGRFKTRREVIRYLQNCCRAAEKVGREPAIRDEFPEYADLLEGFSRQFPNRELEQSVSRGMNKHGGLLLMMENLAKKPG